MCSQEFTLGDDIGCGNVVYRLFMLLPLDGCYFLGRPTLRGSWLALKNGVGPDTCYPYLFVVVTPWGLVYLHPG